jgi:hypothetical protein
MIGNAAVRWLLGIRAIPADAGDLRVAFERPLPAWGWALAVGLAALVAWWSYRRMAASRGRVALLGACRVALLLLLVVLAAGPVLELPRERREPDAVLVLADRSRSMEVADVPAADARITRDAALASLATGPSRLLADAGDAHRVQWYGFAESLAPLEETPDAVALGAATGDQTLLATALEQALERAGGRPVSAIVLLTDGRTTDPPDQALLRRMADEGVPVFAVALGADEPIGDLAVVQTKEPRRAFARDLVPVEAVVERRGPAAGRAAVVELVDTSTGAVLDSATLEPGSGSAPSMPGRDRVTLVGRPGAAGEAVWEVRVRSTAGGDDLVPGNNARSLPITLVDRPLRVLYVEGYPRWEYRYLKNLMQREGTIQSAVMLLSADRNFAQEGNTPITRLPRTREEFERFDLVVLGDVGAGLFTAEQLREIRRLVAERGAGLVWIGGERSTPRAWQGSPLEDLLPFAGTLELERLGRGVHMRPTPAAERLGVLRLADDPRSDFPEALQDPSTSWSRLEWAQRIPAAVVKPTAEVLGESVERFEDAPAPLVLSMRFGAGSVLYVATDEIWRWRYGRGETYPERFWLQLLRMLARPALAAGAEEIQIGVDPGRATVGESVRVEVELPPGPAPDVLVLEAVPDTRGAATAEIETRPGPGGTLVGAWNPDAEGTWTLRPRDPVLAARSGGGRVQVVRSDRELRDAESDRALLERLAAATGGRVVSLRDARTLTTLLPNRSIVTEDPIKEPLWSSPLALAVLLALLAAEWIGRRMNRLA